MGNGVCMADMLIQFKKVKVDDGNMYVHITVM